MIHFLYGDNAFQSNQALKQLHRDYSDPQAQESYEGSDLTIEQLPSLLQGMTLFSSKKQVTIKHAADNKPLWSEMAAYLESLDESIELIIVEASPDKRTKTFKLLQKIAKVQEFASPSESQAKAWLLAEARARSVTLSAKQGELLVERVGTDSWKLHFALEKLRVFDEVSDELLKDVIDTHTEVSVFAVMDNVLSRKHSALRSQLPILKDSQDAYQFFGLLSQQLFLLVTLSVSPHDPQRVAKDLSVHSYPLQKMAPLAKNVSSKERQAISAILANGDDQLKRSGRDPWLIVEQAILALAYRADI